MYNKKILSSILIAISSLFLLIGCDGTAEKNSESEVKTSSNISEKEKISESHIISSGLLLGLSYDGKEDRKINEFNMPSKEFRTLWIYHNGSKLIVKEKDKSIVTPYKDKFYEIKNDYFEIKEKNKENESEGFYLKYNSYYSWNSIVSKAIGEPDKPFFTEESFKDKFIAKNDDWPFKSNMERVDYIGNNYACINSDYYETGGGTYRSGRNHIKLFDIASLGSNNFRDKNGKLYDLLDENVRKELNALVDKKNNEFKADDGNKEDSFIKVERVVDIDNLSLRRKEGKWIVQIPVYERYIHEGNGSNFYKVTEFIPYQCKLPSSITSYDSLSMTWDDIKKAVPDAIDAMSSPEGELMSVTTKDQLLIFINPKEDMKNADLKIPLNNNEIVISNQWATGNYVEKWNKDLDILFK